MLHQQEIVLRRAVATMVFIVAMGQIIATVTSTYIPDIGNYNQLMKRSGQSSDADSDDEMDQEATAPYQQGGRGGDGYEENEPDGPYGESPREEEGQADLEKFFDDHLGASERDGMDKENLPSNIERIVVPLDRPQRNSRHYSHERRIRSVINEGRSKWKPLIIPPQEPQLDTSSSIEDFYSPAPHGNANLTVDFYDDGSQLKPSDAKLNQSHSEIEARYDTGSAPVYTTENEDLDKIYVTNMTDKPFKIEALGGYDPEEDFLDASRDLDDPTKFNASMDEGGKEAGGGQGSGKKKGKVAARVKDIIFTDPETDTLYNDASETDEVTFARDDPDEPEDAIDNSPDSSTDAPPADDSSSVDEESSSENKDSRKKQRRGDNSDDDAEGSWVNDGVEDMDIPSQSHQDRVLNKAAERQALAERNAAADDGSAPEQADDQQPESQDGDGDEESQRMPNADYMKDDMKDEVGGDGNDEALAR